MNCKLLGMIGLVAVGLVGCAKDQTVDDYRAAKGLQKYAEIQAISGTYRGDINSKKDGLSLGALAISVGPDTKVQNSSDNIGTEQQVFVKGTLNYAGVTNANLVFSRGYFDSKTGVFKVDIPVLTIENTQSMISIEGTISNGNFTGNLTVDGISDYGAVFSLTLNGPASSASSLQSSRAQKIKSQNQIFTGKYQLDKKDWPLTLTLRSTETKPDQLFLSIFQPLRSVYATFDDGLLQLNFTSAHIDDIANTLRGQTSIESGSVQVECLSFSVRDVIQSWDCLLSGPRMKEVHAILSAPKPVNP